MEDKLADYFLMEIIALIFTHEKFKDLSVRDKHAMVQDIVQSMLTKFDDKIGKAFLAKKPWTEEW